MRTFLKYLLVHLPEWGLASFVAALAVSWGWLSWPIALALLFMWIAIDIALYPLLRDAYRGKGPTAVEKLVGTMAEALEALSPSGFVRVRGEIWHACLADKKASFPAGTLVRASAAEGLKLTVTTDDCPEPHPATKCDVLK